MVLAALFAGMIAGLATAVFGYAVAELPLWLSGLLYPAVGSAVVVLTAGMLTLRSQPCFPRLWQPALECARVLRS